MQKKFCLVIKLSLFPIFVSFFRRVRKCNSAGQWQQWFFHFLIFFQGLVNKKGKWSYDFRSCERNFCNFCNCVEKPEKFRTSMGFEPVTSLYRGCKNCKNCVHNCEDHSFTWCHIAQLVRASHRYHEVTGSNPVEVLNFSGFSTQLQKLRSQMRIS